MDQQQNFFGLIATSLHPEAVAEIFRRVGWRVRQVSEWGDYEIDNALCKVIIDADIKCAGFPARPLHFHGVVLGTECEIVKHAEELVNQLKEAGMSFGAWCYGGSPCFRVLGEFVHNYDVETEKAISSDQSESRA